MDMLGIPASSVVRKIPIIIGTVFYGGIEKFNSSSSTPLLPIIPKPNLATRSPDVFDHPVKLFLLLFSLAHSHSWPLMWHIRVWWYGIKARYLAYRKGRSKYLAEWKAQNDKNGGVRNLKVRHKMIAGVDDCDYNMHLSNSSYAKNSDVIKMDFCIQAMSPVFSSGAHMALGATHYNFFREIPIGAKYTIETYIVGWDEKWCWTGDRFFVACEFLVYPKKTSRAGAARDKVTHTISRSIPHIIPSISDTPTPTVSPISGPGSMISALAAVSGSATPQTSLGNRIEEVKRSWASKRNVPRADGGVVHCISISEYCFKMSRITIPPRIALWLSMQSPSKEEQERARAVVMSRDAGKEFLRGGWKEDPNAETLGLDIGLGKSERIDESWINHGVEAMGNVVKGMSML
nr:hypothetical protein L204_00124 [Cryptococcus depauperatus CBS 7855]